LDPDAQRLVVIFVQVPHDSCIPDSTVRISVGEQCPHADPCTVRPLHHRPDAPVRSILDNPDFLITHQGILDQHVPDISEDLLKPMNDYNAVSTPLAHMPPVRG
jgi:hypothetical protein